MNRDRDKRDVKLLSFTIDSTVVSEQDFMKCVPSVVTSYKSFFESMRLVGFQILGADYYIAPNFSYHHNQFHCLEDIPFATMNDEPIVGYDFPSVYKCSMMRSEMNTAIKQQSSIMSFRTYDKGEDFVVFNVVTIESVYSVLWSKNRIAKIQCSEPCMGYIRQGKFFITSDVDKDFKISTKYGNEYEIVLSETYHADIEFKDVVEVTIDFKNYVFEQYPEFYVTIQNQSLIFIDRVYQIPLEDGVYELQPVKPQDVCKFKIVYCGMNFGIIKRHLGLAHSQQYIESSMNVVSVEDFILQHKFLSVSETVVVIAPEEIFEDSDAKEEDASFMEEEKLFFDSVCESRQKWVYEEKCSGNCHVPHLFHVDRNLRVQTNKNYVDYKACPGFIQVILKDLFDTRVGYFVNKFKNKFRVFEFNLQDLRDFYQYHDCNYFQGSKIRKREIDLFTYMRMNVVICPRYSPRCKIKKHVFFRVV